MSRIFVFTVQAALLISELRAFFNYLPGLRQAYLEDPCFIRDDRLMTTISEVCTVGYKDFLEDLLKDDRLPEFLSPAATLDLAFDRDHYHIVRHLLRSGRVIPSAKAYILECLRTDDRMEMLSVVLEHKMDRVSKGSEIWYRVIRDNLVEAAEILLKDGMITPVPDGDHTLLFMAIEFNRGEMCGLLAKDSRVDLNYLQSASYNCNLISTRPLFYSILQGRERIMKFLLNHPKVILDELRTVKSVLRYGNIQMVAHLLSDRRITTSPEAMKPFYQWVSEQSSLRSHALLIRSTGFDWNEYKKWYGQSKKVCWFGPPLIEAIARGNVDLVRRFFRGWMRFTHGQLDFLGALAKANPDENVARHFAHSILPPSLIIPSNLSLILPVTLNMADLIASNPFCRTDLALRLVHKAALVLTLTKVSPTLFQTLPIAILAIICADAIEFV